MFFYKQSYKKKRYHERNQQRVYLYSQLYQALQDAEWGLIWPINQLLDIKNDNMKGYCHGYSEVWTKHVTTEKGLTEPFFTDADWRHLLTEEAYPFAHMPLSTQIKFKQSFMPSGPAYRSRGETIYCPAVDNMAEEIVSQTLEKVALVEKERGSMLHVFVVCLGNKRDERNCFDWFFSKKVCSKRPQWHETRLVIDTTGQVHWFDANVGWLRSHMPYPDKQCLQKDFTRLFALLQYPEKYRFVSVFELQTSLNASHSQPFQLS